MHEVNKLFFRYIISQFTLNSLDLGSRRTNTFSFHAPVLDLFEYCGLQEAKVSLQGLNMDTFRWDKLPDKSTTSYAMLDFESEMKMQGKHLVIERHILQIQDVL